VRRSPAPLFEEPSEDPDALLVVPPAKENRRLAFLAVSAFILVPVVVMAAYLGGRTPASTVAPRSSACPVDSTIPSVAAAAPSAVPSAAHTPDPAEPTKAMAAVTHPAVTIREAPRWLPAPPTPPVQANAPPQTTPPRAIVTRRGSTNDDPLSDQQ
jgi:hypothetical protein